MKPTIDSPFPDVRLVKPSNSLKARIGTPLAMIFTPEKIRSAQEVFDRGTTRLANECKQDVAELRKVCHSAIDDPDGMDLAEIIRLTSNIKGCGTMSGYPLVTTMADILMGFLSDIQPYLDPIALAISVTLADAINAVLIENRRSISDATSDAVITQVKQSIRDYMIGKK